MLLSKPDLKEEVRQKRVVIRRPREDGSWWQLSADSEDDEKWFQEASIDLTLDSDFLLPTEDYQPSDAFTIELGRIPAKKLRATEKKDFVVLEPRGFILGWTAERITIPLSLCGWIEGKSGPARNGLVVHFTAPHIAPGFGLIPSPQRIQLEIANLGEFGLKLVPGTPIAQLILMKLSSPLEIGYAGEFAQQAP